MDCATETGKIRPFSSFPERHRAWWNRKRDSRPLPSMNGWMKTKPNDATEAASMVILDAAVEIQTRLMVGAFDIPLELYGDEG